MVEFCLYVAYGQLPLYICNGSGKTDEYMVACFVYRDRLYIYMCMYLRIHISEPRGQEAVLELGVAKPSPRARHRFKTEPFQREAHESAGQTLSFQVGQLNLVPKVVALALSSYLWSVCGEQTNISLKLCFVYHWLLSRPV